MRSLWTVRQEKTLTLARALHCCAERSGAPTGVLCNTTQQLQRCMAPLMCLNGYKIVETSLLEPTWDRHGTSPTPEERATILGEKQGPSEAPEAIAPFQECLETPQLKETTEQFDALSTPVPSKVCHDASQKTKRSQQRIEPPSLPTANPDIISNWVLAYLEKSREIPNWWWEFWSICCQGAKPLNNPQVQALVSRQAAAFRLPLAQQEKSSWWSTAPCLSVLKWGDFLLPPFQGVAGQHGGASPDSSIVHHTIRNAPGSLCGAIQKLQRCPTPLLERGDLLDITMLNVAEKDPVTPPVPTERASSPEKKPEPWKEEPTTVPTHYRQETSEPEGAAHLGELAIMQRQFPPAPPEFTRSWVDESDPLS